MRLVSTLQAGKKYPFIHFIPDRITGLIDMKQLKEGKFIRIISAHFLKMGSTEIVMSSVRLCAIFGRYST
jgi:hypothetical protein